MTRANGHDGEHANGADKAIDGEAYASVGAWLAARRRALGSTLEAVEAATRVRQDYLEAIEDMDPRRMPTGPYAPGFVRTYALHLGLDPEEVGGRFAKELSPRHARAPRLENAESFGGFSISPRTWGAIGAAAVLIGLIGYGLRPREDDGFNVVPPVPEGLQEWAQAEVATRVSSAAQELVGGPELALRARIPAFVEARTRAGDTFIARTLDADETWVVPRVPGVVVTVDNGAAIEVMRGGRSEGRLGRPGLPVIGWSADVAREFGAAQVGVVSEPVVEAETEEPAPSPELVAAVRAESERVADEIVSEIEREASLVTPELPVEDDVITQEVLPAIIIGDVEPVADPAEAAAAAGPVGGDTAAEGAADLDLRD